MEGISQEFSPNRNQEVQKISRAEGMRNAGEAVAAEYGDLFGGENVVNEILKKYGVKSRG